VTDVLGDNKQILKPVLFFQFGKIGENLADQVLGLAVDTKAVLEFVVLFGHQVGVFRGQRSGGQDGDFLIF
jgi:hypothetical protein